MCRVWWSGIHNSIETSFVLIIVRSAFHDVPSTQQGRAHETMPDHERSGLQAWKAEFRNRRRKIVPARFRKVEKLRSHYRAHRVTPNVLLTGVAAAVPIEARHRFKRANFKWLAEHIWCRALTAGVVVSQHCGVRALRSSSPKSPRKHFLNSAFRNAPGFCGIMNDERQQEWIRSAASARH